MKGHFESPRPEPRTNLIFTPEIHAEEPPMVVDDFDQLLKKEEAKEQPRY